MTTASTFWMSLGDVMENFETITIGHTDGLFDKRVLNADMLDDELEEAMRAEIEDLDPIFFSSVAQQGLQQLKDRIWQSMESATVW